MTIREGITGTYDREAIDRLGWPTAWSGTVSQADRREQDHDVAELIEEAREIFSNPDVEAVEIERGVIAFAVMYPGDEDEIEKQVRTLLDENDWIDRRVQSGLWEKGRVGMTPEWIQQYIMNDLRDGRTVKQAFESLVKESEGFVAQDIERFGECGEEGRPVFGWNEELWVLPASEEIEA